ncbi:M12 family metallo-peptidase [Aquimonas voraii]|uniref:Metallo-peptidase family M12 n=1 Tax=Aquimonas voraii TaxID=265719 RepID=A0A1G6RXJ4_9GAMM|nr:M12 family metallo-peptidase [Aquimonas voraii]SDD09173.1 Metallo-peptidase family M12 [Aquimonas voraii]
MRSASDFRPTLRRLLAGLALSLPLGAALAETEARILAHAEARLETDRRAQDRLNLQIEGQTLQLRLRENHALLAALPPQSRASIDALGTHYEGEIEGIEGSWLRLSLIDGRYSGAYFDGTELVLLDRADTLAASLVKRAPASADTLLAYRLRDVELPGLVDDVVAVPGYPLKTGSARTSYENFARHLRGAAAGPGKLGSPVRQLAVTVVTDTEFGSVHGGNRDAVVASRINVVDGIYSDQFQTRIVVGTLRHLSDNGTLNTTVVSGSDTLLTRFRTYMTSGAGSNIPKGGLNHLFSGKDFDGNTVGVAYLSVLCSTSFGYGINQVRAANTTTALTIAHEMGHNFGASHDGQSGSVCESQTGSWLMSPSLNGSSTFSPCARTSIEPRIQQAACFQPVVVPGAVFRNGFEVP